MQSELSQKEEHQYSILTHKYRIRKEGNDNPIYMRQQKRHRCIEQFFGHCGRGRGWYEYGRMALKHVNYM